MSGIPLQASSRHPARLILLLVKMFSSFYENSNKNKQLCLPYPLNTAGGMEC